uniref:cardiolipin synthase (CMP-forming) n=2 Tax=Parascaris univalens TaxID=6257 RepID=A0A915BT38_PARUN
MNCHNCRLMRRSTNIFESLRNSMIAIDRHRFCGIILRLYGNRREENILLKNLSPPTGRIFPITTNSFSDRECAFKGNIQRIRKQLTNETIQFHDNIMTIPNALSILRIGLTPIIGYLVVEECFTIAISLFSIAGITDLLDGYIARNVKGQSSLLGSALDPIADKLLVSTLFITLTYVDLIPCLLTAVVILRDLSLLIGGFVKRYRALMPPMTLRRFFDPSISPMRVAPTVASKVNTALQLSLVACSLVSPLFDFVGHPSLTVLCMATGATTVFSGLQYAMMDRMKRVSKHK